MGSATVAFGMVSIPTKLFTSSDSTKSVSFNMLHDKCKTRVKQQLYCPVDDEVVERSDIIKGYEFAKDQYVTFTPDELKELEAASTQTIEISEFIPAKLIDPIYYAKAYYLSPDRGGERPYRLLIEAMKKTERVALARYAARGKEYLVMLRVMNGALIMQQLRYQDEVKSITEIPIPDTEVKENELALAMQLIDHVSSDKFEPEKYGDAVGDRVRDLIQKKVEGQEIVAASHEAPKAQIIDLMSALKASLGESSSAKSYDSDEKESKKRAS